MNRNFPPGGFGRNPRRKKGKTPSKTPKEMPRGTPRASRPTKGKTFLPLVIIREAAIRRETPQQKNIRRTYHQHTAEKKYVNALMDARTLIANEVIHFLAWNKMIRPDVQRAVKVLREKYESLRRKHPLGKSENVERVMKAYTMERTKGETLLTIAAHKLKWSQDELRKIDVILTSSNEPNSIFIKKLAKDKLAALNGRKYYADLVNPPTSE